MTRFYVVNNPMRDLANQARERYFARTNHQAAYRLFELDPTTDHEVAFLKARAAWLDVIGGGS